MTTRSTPASSIIDRSFSMVNGSGNCGFRPGTHFQSGVSAFHRCAWASTIIRPFTAMQRSFPVEIPGWPGALRNEQYFSEVLVGAHVLMAGLRLSERIGLVDRHLDPASL